MCCEICVLFGLHGGFLIFEVGVHSVQQGFQISSVVVVDAVEDSVEQSLVLFINLVVLQHNKYIDINEINSHNLAEIAISITDGFALSYYAKFCLVPTNIFTEYVRIYKGLAKRLIDCCKTFRIEGISLYSQ